MNEKPTPSSTPTDPQVKKLSWGITPAKKTRNPFPLKELLLRADERCDTIEAAICGGVRTKHDKTKCTCDLDVGFTCEYCAVQGSVHHLRGIIKCIRDGTKAGWISFTVMFIILVTAIAALTLATEHAFNRRRQPTPSQPVNQVLHLKYY